MFDSVVNCKSIKLQKTELFEKRKKIYNWKNTTSGKNKKKVELLGITINILFSLKIYK